MASIPPCDTRQHAIWLEPGSRFGGWTVVGTPIGSRPDVRPNLYPCRCDCGRLQHVLVYDLLKERTSHCRYCRHGGERNANYRHGGCTGVGATRLYHLWHQMKRRCGDPKAQDWPNYGARGITVCEEWLDFRTFRAWATTHGYAQGLTLERVDNNGGYCRANCCWVPRSEQAKNRRTSLKNRQAPLDFGE